MGWQTRRAGDECQARQRLREFHPHQQTGNGHAWPGHLAARGQQGTGHGLVPGRRLLAPKQKCSGCANKREALACGLGYCLDLLPRPTSPGIKVGGKKVAARCDVMRSSAAEPVKRIRVLILEDNPISAQANVRALSQAGFDLEWECVQTLPDFVLALSRSPGFRRHKV